MTPTVPEIKRGRGRPKGSKDRVVRKSANNNDQVRASPTNSASSTPAPPSKRRASSSAGTPQLNGFTAINVGDRNTSRSGRSLSKTPKVTPQAAEPESLGPALKKRVPRSTSRVSSAEISTPTSTPAPTQVPGRKRLPDHGSQSIPMATPAPAPAPAHAVAVAVAPSSAPPSVANGYRSLYGQSPYGTPPMHNGPMMRIAPNGHFPNGQFPNNQFPNGQFPPGPYPNGPYQPSPYRSGPAGPILYTQSQLQFPSFPESEPPINTIQPAPGSMSAPRMIPPKRTALPEQRRYFAPAAPIHSRPIAEILSVYEDLYSTVHKQYKSFETHTWNVSVRNINRNVFIKLAAMRARRARLTYMLKEVKSLKKTGTLAMLIDTNFAQWPPVMGQFPAWYYSLETSGLKYELGQRIKSMRMQISGQLGEFERAMFMGQNLRVVKSTAMAEEMKWLEIQSQIREYESMISRLGDVDRVTRLTIEK